MEGKEDLTGSRPAKVDSRCRKVHAITLQPTHKHPCQPGHSGCGWQGKRKANWSFYGHCSITRGKQRVGPLAFGEKVSSSLRLLFFSNLSCQILAQMQWVEWPAFWLLKSSSINSHPRCDQRWAGACGIAGPLANYCQIT